MANYNKLVSLVVFTAIYNNTKNPYILCGTVTNEQIQATEAYKNMQSNMQKHISNMQTQINERDNKISTLSEGLLIQIDDFNDSEIDSKINEVGKAVYEALKDNILEQKEIDSIKKGLISLYSICAKKNIDKHTDHNLILAQYLRAQIFEMLKVLIHQNFRDKYTFEVEINFSDKSLAYQMTYIAAELEILRQLTLPKQDRTSDGDILNNLFPKLTITGHIDNKVTNTIKSVFTVNPEALKDCALISCELKKSYTVVCCGLRKLHKI
jgi:hypothetical protein